MTERSQIRVVAGPLQFAMLRDALEREGVTVEGDNPTEKRGGTVETITWIFIAIGLDRAVDAAVAQVKDRWPGIEIRVNRKNQDE